jgi:hypothetical protein
MKQWYSVDVRGLHKQWGFPIKAKPEHVADWRADGIEVTGPILNTIPWWAAWPPLIDIWIAVQDAWRWLRMW